LISDNGISEISYFGALGSGCVTQNGSSGVVSVPDCWVSVWGEELTSLVADPVGVG